MKKIMILLTIAMIFTGCEEVPQFIESTATDTPHLIPVSQDALPLNERMLGINISESKDGFFDSFTYAQQAQIDIIELNIPWNAIEPKANEYTDPWGGVFQQISFYGENDIQVALSIALINTVAWELPPDLKLADENFADRFNSMISFVFDIIPDNVTIASVSIGNEVDFVLQDDEWQAYGEFVSKAYTHIKSINPDVTVGVKTTVMGGLMGYQKDYIIAVNEHTDVVMLNYYPQNEKFEVLDPDIVFEHFDYIADTFPDREIWITEIGYQSGENYCKSSEAMQAEFYHNMFTAWDEHAQQIKVVQIDWLHDQSDSNIKDFKSYYGNDKALIEYLSTLGLRNYDSTDKMAWVQLLDEVAARK